MTTRMTIPNPEFSVSTDAALRQALAGFPQLELALVFGSVARGTPRPDSDVDMAVACPHRALTVDETLDIVAALAQHTGRPVDLIDLYAVAPPLLGQIVRHGRRVLGSDAAYGHLISRNLFDQADFAPYRNRVLTERRAAWMPSL